MFREWKLQRYSGCRTPVVEELGEAIKVSCMVNEHQPSLCTQWDTRGGHVLKRLTTWNFGGGGLW
jgi:hypothetical protein